MRVAILILCLNLFVCSHRNNFPGSGMKEKTMPSLTILNSDRLSYLNTGNIAKAKCEFLPFAFPLYNNMKATDTVKQVVYPLPLMMMKKKTSGNL